MSFVCVPNPEVPGTWGFAHACANCEAHGPVVGTLPQMADTAEMQKYKIVCGGPVSHPAFQAGWLTGGERDLCPKCRPAG